MPTTENFISVSSWMGTILSAINGVFIVVVTVCCSVWDGGIAITWLVENNL